MSLKCNIIHPLQRPNKKDALEWKYVGEAGVDMKARNSHSMAVLSKQVGSETLRYLVVYGGASPEEGPLGDTLYTALPDPKTIGKY